MIRQQEDSNDATCCENLSGKKKEPTHYDDEGTPLLNTRLQSSSSTGRQSSSSPCYSSSPFRNRSTSSSSSQNPMPLSKTLTDKNEQNDNDDNHTQNKIYLHWTVSILMGLVSGSTVGTHEISRPRWA
mmetsp:Transcript_13077/g.36190  ORF Transcript_13077/g.36190 Transcript_13077/m.36190 type:complete len:128 (+) Transcript_13077:128-511(+)